MENASLVQVITAASSGLFAGVIGTVVTHFLTTTRRKAELKNLEAQTDNLNAQTEKLKQQSTAIRDRQDKVEFLIKHFVTGPELYFLKQFANESDFFEFKNHFREKEHLRWLRDKGFIKNIMQKSINDLQPGENLKQFYKIEDKGKLYLEYAAKLEQ